MRMIYTLFFCIMTVMPAHADQRYLSQSEIEALLALSDATPESAGMKQLRVCRLIGESKNPGAHPNQSSVGQVASRTVYQSLQRFAVEYQRSKPQWSWRVACTPEWQLITPGFTRLVGGERRLKEVSWVDPNAVADTTKSVPNTNTEVVRVRFEGKAYLLKGETLTAWNACKGLRFKEGGPVVRKKDCK